MTIRDVAILLAVALAFLVPLAGYALHLHLEAKRKQQLAHAKHQQEEQQANTQLYAQISLICRAVQARQMDSVEACLRLRVLLDLLEHGRYVQHNEWQVIDLVYQQAKHLATHQAYLDLENEEKERQDQQRRALKEHHESSLLNAVNALDTFCQSQRS